MAEYTGTVIRDDGPTAKPYTGEVIPSTAAAPPAAAAPVKPPPPVSGGPLEFTAGSMWRHIANAAGLPWDTVENVYNLGKAGVHAAGTAMGMTDKPFQAHTGVLGGSQSIQDAMRRARLIPPGSEPESFPGRLADAAIGGAITAPLTPGAQMRSIPQAVRLGGMGATSGVGAEVGGAIAPEGAEPVGRLAGSLAPGAGRLSKPPTRSEEATAGRKADAFGKAYEKGIPVPPKALKPSKPKQVLEDEMNADLGQPAGTPSSPEVFKNYRNAQWSAYEKIINSPLLAKGVQATPAFKAEIQKIGQELEAARGALPQTFKTGDPTLKLLREYGYLPALPKGASAGSASQIQNKLGMQPLPPQLAMRAVRKLREDASTNFASENTEQVNLAHIQKRIANALEEAIEQGLRDPKAMAAFREARTNIAKAHDWEDSIDPVTRTIAPERVSKLMTEGRPLSGKLREMAELSGALPQAMRTPEDQDLFTHRVTPMAMGHPTAMMAHWLSRMDPRMSRLGQTMIDPRNKQGFDQEQMLRYLQAAMSQQNIPPPPQ